MARLRRFFSRPTYANVMSTIAVFAVLSSGYAVAFSGSGSLQKAKVTGISQASSETVRSLTGIGSLSAICSEIPEVGANTNVNFQNSSGQGLYVHYTSAGDPDDLTPFPSPSVGTIEVTTDETEEFRLHIYPTAADDKAPQAEVTVSVRADEESCADAEVAVLVLNTQQ